MNSGSLRSVARAAPRVGIIVVDHGSRRAEANDALDDVVARYRAHASGGTQPVAVEPAHMELASPTIADAFARCVACGAEEVVCAPFFLSMGRHMKEDIPALMSEAAAAHPAVRWSIAAPLGAQPSMPALMHEVAPISSRSNGRAGGGRGGATAAVPRLSAPLFLRAMRGQQLRPLPPPLSPPSPLPPRPVLPPLSVLELECNRGNLRSTWPWKCEGPLRQYYEGTRWHAQF